MTPQKLIKQKSQEIRRLSLIVVMGQQVIDLINNEDLPFLLVITDNANLTFYKMGAASFNILGYAPAEMEGRSWNEFIINDDIAKTQEVEKNLQTNTKNISSFTNRYKCKDGTIKAITWYIEKYAQDYRYSLAVGICN